MENAAPFLNARVRPIAESLLDCLLPARCAGCGVKVSSPTGLCAPCWSRTLFLERPWCERLGTPFSHDVGNEVWSPKAIADPPLFDRHRSVARYHGPARDMVLALKFSGRRELAEPMGTWMARAAAGLLSENCLIVPVPLHRFRLWRRRFNQSADLARVIARNTGSTYEPRLLRRRKRTRQQVGLSGAERRRNVRAAFEIRTGWESLVLSRNVVLVDDVYTTGSTVTSCTRTLLAAGAARVDVITFALADPEAGQDL